MGRKSIIQITKEFINNKAIGEEVKREKLFEKIERFYNNPRDYFGFYRGVYHLFYSRKYVNDILRKMHKQGYIEYSVWPGSPWASCFIVKKHFGSN